ncbi:MAG TPA: TonB-dependent receptor [Ferruginibacter sp.]|jgi:TonB-dependent receptor|nr:TonB-dependent receptor [Ferruginibacter sp.]
MYSQPIRLFLFSLIFIIGISASSFSQTIKGSAFDAKTGEPLVGATVHLEDTKYSVTVNLDGSYVFKNVKPGTYKIEIDLIDYAKPEDISIEVKDGNTIVRAPDFKLYQSDKKLIEVLLTSKDKKSDAAARSMEQKSDYIQNILSQRAIELSPDVTVANALQRVSGVNVQRDNNGEGRYAIIRGMDQRYNTTLINGIKIPSPDDKYRYVPMDLFPSELIERIEVIKALTPNMEGDAIGGVMNLVMKSAPDKFIFNVNASGGYSFLFSDRPFSAFDHSGMNKNSPDQLHGSTYSATPTDFSVGNLYYHNLSAPISSMIGLTIGNRFFNKKLGVIVSAAYQNFYKGSNSDFFVLSSQGYATTTGSLPNFTDADSRQFSTQTNRIAVNNKIDYIFNDRNKISLFNFYVHQNDYQARFTQDSTYGTNSSGTAKDVDIKFRSKWQIQDLYNATLQGEHCLSNKLKFAWSGVYSIAENRIPDLSSYDYNDEVKFGNNGKIVSDSLSTYGSSVGHTWQYNTDKDLAGYANLTYKPHLFGKEVEFEGGGLYRNKTRTNYYAEYSLDVSTTPMPQNVQPLNFIETLPPSFSPNGGNQGSVATTQHNNVYTAHETITAEYIQTKFMLTSKLQVLGGVRIENTEEDYTLTNQPIALPGQNATYAYTDVLPSIHFKYALNDKQNIRASYFKSLSRPGFGDIVPALYPPDDGDYDFKGNDTLQHTTADNYDLRYELFPGRGEQLILGAFYKSLQNPIEYYVTSDGNSTSKLIITPENPPGGATNFGFEAVFTKYFGKFGIAANYTYTNSKVTTTKLVYSLTAGPNPQEQTTDTTQTRPLQGQAANIGNISLLYKNPKIGLDVQLALAYTGDFILQVSPYYNQDYWQKAYTQLDFSMEKKIAKHFAFFAKVNNILNSQHKEFVKFSVSQTSTGNYGIPIPYQDHNNKNITIVERDITNTNFLAGFKYKF